MLRDVLGHPGLLARAAGVVDPEARENAHQAVSGVGDAAEVLRRRQLLRLELLVRQQSAGEPLQREPIQRGQHRDTSLPSSPKEDVKPRSACPLCPDPTGASRHDTLADLEPTSRPSDDEDVRDLLGDPDALARAAGIVDPDAFEHARQAIGRVVDAEEALRRAYSQ